MSLMMRLRVGPRLAAGFAVVLLMVVGMLVVMLYGSSRTATQFEQVVDVNMRKTRLLNSLLDTNNAMVMHRRLMVIKQGEDLQQDLARTASLADNYQTVWKEYIQIPRDSFGDTAVERIAAAQRDAGQLGQTVDALMAQGDYVQTTDLVIHELTPKMARWNAAIGELIAHQQTLTANTRAQYLSTVQGTRTAAWVFALLSIVLGSGLAWLITRSLTEPLALATRAAHDLANGNLDTRVSSTAHDEVGDVLRAIAQSQQAIVLLRDGLTETARQHNAGTVSYQSDTSQLQGDYRRVGDAINSILQEHVGAALLAGRLADRYARGDLSEDFPRLPGEKAALMQAMDNVKASVTRISQQILQLSTAAVNGDFSVRGDESQFEYGFRDMVANLNQLMRTADGSLGDLSHMLKAIAAGDLTAQMQGNYNGVFAAMQDDANATVAQLRQIVGGIQSAATSINVAAGEIAQGNAELSRRTEQQAANLEETAASMEELTSTVRQNAESARQANQLTIAAHTVATDGGQATADVVTTMGQIEQSSRRIADIISVIDGIAFQTNILALNAAVEAARAGEQGRGFAVVASEVRTLAQRSAEAAKEIKGLIDDSVGKVAIGSEQVRKAGQTMAEIVTSVQQVTDIMAEISAASQEQSAGIEQVNQTVVQMDEATQQNAALVEEASAAARAMEEQAVQLTQAVSVFKLSSDNAHAGQPATALNIPRATHRPAPTTTAAARSPAATTPVNGSIRPAIGVAATADDSPDWQEF